MQPNRRRVGTLKISNLFRFSSTTTTSIIFVIGIVMYIVITIVGSAIGVVMMLLISHREKKLCRPLKSSEKFCYFLFWLIILPIEILDWLDDRRNNMLKKPSDSIYYHKEFEWDQQAWLESRNKLSDRIQERD